MNLRTLHILILLAVLSGCDTNNRLKDSTDALGSVRSESVRGPVTLIVEITPDVVRLSDEPTLTVTIKSEPGVEIKKPPFGKSVGEFLIRNFHEPPPTTDGKSNVTQQVYTLEPTRAGTLTIAPIGVRFQDDRTAGDGDEHIVESEAVQVEVHTIVGNSAPSLTDLKPSIGPRQLPSAGPPGWLWMAGGLVAAVISTALIWWRQRQQRTVKEPPLTPRQLAQLELDRIISRRLSETDVKEFYIELTGVVRRYIERSTGVRAPEQTTEEFLREIVTNSVFTDDEQYRFQQFLESADLVKFAGHRPVRDDMDASISRAREFTQQGSCQPEETAE